MTQVVTSLETWCRYEKYPFICSVNDGICAVKSA